MHTTTVTVAVCVCVPACPYLSVLVCALPYPTRIAVNIISMGSMIRFGFVSFRFVSYRLFFPSYGNAYGNVFILWFASFAVCNQHTYTHTHTQ